MTENFYNDKTNQNTDDKPAKISERELKRLRRSQFKPHWPHFSIDEIVDDMEMSLYALRLYIHLKRIAGLYEDKPIRQFTKMLAKHCHMTITNTNKTLKELEELGLIETQKLDNKYGDPECLEIGIIKLT